MQSDRKHELESNALADSVAALADRVRPYFGAIGLAGAALAVGCAAWTVMQSRGVAAREESWNAVLSALSTGQSAALEQVAATYPGTPAAQWARLITADGLLDQGSQALFIDRTQAEQRLRAAESAYAGLLAASPLSFVAERATFGLAKARENLGQLDEARRGYETVVREHPGSAVRRLAEARIAALGRDSTRQWYDWFAQQKPAPPKADGAATESAESADAAAGAGADQQPSGTGTGTDASR